MGYMHIASHCGLNVIGIVIGILLGRLLPQRSTRTSEQERNPPVEPVPDGAEKLEVAKLYLQEWTTVIQTQMHFNDLIIRFRTTVLTVLVALLGAFAAAAKSEYPKWAVQDIGFLLFFPIAFWATACIIDIFYYHRLLLGAVAQAEKYDGIGGTFFGLFGMTEVIKKHVRPSTSKYLVFAFYALPVLILAAGWAIFHVE